MATAKYVLGDSLHPDSENKLYTVHLADQFILGSDITSADWSVSAGATIVTSSYANVGSSDHTAAQVRDDATYSGPLISVWITSDGATAGDRIFLTCAVTTALEGPIHVVVAIDVSAAGH